MNLLIANIVYVVYRLAVSGVIVKFLSKYVNYYIAVLIMAQLSFFYDNLNFYFYFDQKSIEISNIIISDILYTARVIAAWYIIKLLWKKLKNYWLSVLIGAELTFVVDYYIFGNIAYS